MAGGHDDPWQMLADSGCYQGEDTWGKCVLGEVLGQGQHGQQLLIASAKQAEQDRLSSYINNSIGIQSRFSAAMQKPSNH